MVWFKVDDGLPRSRKVLSIPKRRRAAAIGVWALAGAWSAGELTNGFIPDYALDEIPSGPQCAADLVSAGLWRRVSKGARRSATVSPMDPRGASDVSPIDPQVFPADGFEFHDWDAYQRSRDEVLKERAEHAARQKAYRDRKKAERDGQRDASRAGGVTAASVTTARPDPTRPDPTVVPTELLGEVAPAAPSKPAQNRGHRLPESFEVSDAMRQWAFEHTPEVDIERATMRFRNHWAAESGAKATKVDWVAAWRNWLLKDGSNVRPSGNGYQRRPGERKAMY